MSIRLYFSNNLGYLARKLADDLAEEDRGRDPFVPATLVVPNPNLKKWLQLRLADGGGVAINVQFPFLERGLWRALATLAPSLTAGLTPLDQPRLQLLLLSLLLTPGDDPELVPLRAYLRQPDGGERPDTSRRAWQLAARLAGYFLEYEYHRQAMIRGWLRGELARDCTDAADPDRTMERCQMALYRHVFASGGLRDRFAELSSTVAPDEPAMAPAGRAVTLPELADLVFAAPEVLPAADAPPLHLFGLSQFSAFHRDLLLRLARYRPIRLYQMNVCAEFWEDVTTPAEDRWLRRQRLPQAGIVTGEDGESLAELLTENPLLKYWGKPGRENLRLLSELEERSIERLDFQSWWLPAIPAGEGPTTVLDILRRQVLGRTAERPGNGLPQDTSVQVLACPGIVREVETVYQAIVANLQADPALQLNDIAVLVPDMATYKPIVEEVFNREPRLVPYNLSDASAADDSIYGRAVLSLLDLAAGSFTRSDVFALVLNPCFLAAARISRQEGLVWARWADALNVFHSLDAADKAERGYPSSHVHTWHQALRRLRLGRIMQPPDTAVDPEAASEVGGFVPYADMESQNASQLDTFCGVLEELFSGLRGLHRTRFTGREWRRRLTAILDRLLAPPPDAPAERYVQLGLSAGLRRLDDLDRLLATGPDGEPQTFALPLVAELIRATLADIPSRRGSYLSGGINISSLRPMRPIPFEIVFILGLGEGEFPGLANPSTLDLRQRYRRIGDVAAPDENRYLFLETLVSTKRKLYLSYVSHELAKDQTFHPCSVVNQLIGYLDAHVLRSPFTIARMPLHAHSDAFLSPCPFPGCDAWRQVAVADRLLCLRELGTRYELALPAVDAAIAERTPDRIPPAIPAALRPTVETVPLRDLARFLRNPVEAALRRHLGLYDATEDDPFLADDEPFFSDSGQTRQIILDVLVQAIAAGHRPDADIAAIGLRLLDRRYQADRLLGHTPEGAFADYDHDQLAASLGERLRGGPNVKESLAALVSRLRVIHAEKLAVLGDHSGREPASRQFPALRLNVALPSGAQAIELHGQLPLCWGNPGECHEALIVTHRSIRGSAPDQALLEPLLFLMAAKAGGGDAAAWLGERPFILHLAHRGGIRHFTYEIAADEATAYLHDLVSDFLDPATFDLLPFDLIRETAHGAPWKDDVPATDDDRQAYAQALAEACADDAESAFAKVRLSDLVRLAEPRVPADAFAKVRQRFSLVFRCT